MNDCKADILQKNENIKPWRENLAIKAEDLVSHLILNGFGKHKKEQFQLSIK